MLKHRAKIRKNEKNDLTMKKASLREQEETGSEEKLFCAAENRNAADRKSLSDSHCPDMFQRFSDRRKQEYKNGEQTFRQKK